ncbi:hypothetical protein XANCAGTX0491_006155 [Xanthoria calcicola]
MNPHISIPRQHGSNANFGGTTPTARSNGLRMPRFFKRLLKFPQMDFEMAVWEMTHLIIAPKKVFRSIYYHKQTKNTYHLADPSFTYLLSSFQLLTGIAWGIATQGYVGPTLRLTLMFIFVHFLLSSLVIATLAYLLIGRLLGPGGKGLPPRMRRRGLFGEEGGGRDGETEDLEFGYCFDVSGIQGVIHYVVTSFRRTANGLCLSRSPSALFSPSGSVYMSDSSCYGISSEGITGYPSFWVTPCILSPLAIMSSFSSWDIMRYPSCSIQNCYWVPLYCTRYFGPQVCSDLTYLSMLRLG